MGELAARRSLISFTPSETGYESTSDQWEKVRDVYQCEVSGLLSGRWVYAMVVVLSPGGYLPPHCDGAPPAGVTRYHLVLQTNDDAWCYHDRGWERLSVGYIYRLDATKRHGAVNWGEVDRIHLVMDIHNE